MTQPARRFAVLLNKDAGRVRHDPELTRDAIERAFEARGLEAHVDLCDPAAMAEALARAHQTDVDAVVVGGGDGSLAHAASELAHNGMPLGILPMGTFNLLARDLAIPPTPDDAVEALAHAEIRRVDVGLVNGHTFLMHASLGIHPWLIRRRDKKHPRTRIGRMVSTVNTAARALRHAPALDVAFSCHGRARRVSSRALVITVGTVERGLGQAWRRYAADAGYLAVYANRRGSSPLRMVWDTAHAPWHESDTMDLWTAAELEVTSRHSPLPVALDGDVVGLESPLRFSLLPQALSVLVPVPVPDE